MCAIVLFQSVRGAIALQPLDPLRRSTRPSHCCMSAREVVVVEAVEGSLGAAVDFVAE